MNRIGSYRIFFKNTEKETANQTVELISNKNKKFGMKTSFFKQILQSTIFLFLFLNKVWSFSSRLLRVLLGFYETVFKDKNKNTVLCSIIILIF